MTEREPLLFDRLPVFPIPLPDDELEMLSDLPIWPTNQLILCDESRTICERLARRGLIKISRLGGEMWAGKLETAQLHAVGLRTNNDGA